MHIVMAKRAILTFFGWLSSSVGYHFWALVAGCGIVLWPFPNFFVSEVADILGYRDEVLEKKMENGISKLSTVMLVVGCLTWSPRSEIGEVVWDREPYQLAETLVPIGA